MTVREPLHRRHLLVVGALLLTAAVSAWLPRVEKRAPDSRLELARVVPERVGAWRLLEVREVETSGGANEMVESPYLHADGSLIQLTLEYGSDQRRAHELHYPHTCHRVRGDEVILLPQAPLRVSPDLTLPTFPLHWHQPSSGASAYCRFWLVVEGKPTVDIPALKLRQLAYGILGRPVSAVLVRIDLPSGEPPSTEVGKRLDAVVSEFAVSLHGALTPEGRRLLFGDGPASDHSKATLGSRSLPGSGMEHDRIALRRRLRSRSEGV